MATATATVKEKLPPVASTLRLYHKGINFPSNRYNIILTLKVCSIYAFHLIDIIITTIIITVVQC